jgi:hypothetical protein
MTSSWYRTVRLFLSLWTIPQSRQFKCILQVNNTPFIRSVRLTRSTVTSVVDFYSFLLFFSHYCGIKMYIYYSSERRTCGDKEDSVANLWLLRLILSRNATQYFKDINLAVWKVWRSWRTSRRNLIPVSTSSYQSFSHLKEVLTIRFWPLAKRPWQY